MKTTQLSTSVTLIEDATKAQIQQMQKTARKGFIESCTNSPSARVPSEEDLDYWWPLTVKSDVP